MGQWKAAGKNESRRSKERVLTCSRDERRLRCGRPATDVGGVSPRLRKHRAPWPQAAVQGSAFPEWALRARYVGSIPTRGARRREAIWRDLGFHTAEGRVRFPGFPRRRRACRPRHEYARAPSHPRGGSSIGQSPQLISGSRLGSSPGRPTRGKVKGGWSCHWCDTPVPRGPIPLPRTKYKCYDDNDNNGTGRAGCSADPDKVCACGFNSPQSHNHRRDDHASDSGG